MFSDLRTMLSTLFVLALLRFVHGLFTIKQPSPWDPADLFKGQTGPFSAAATSLNEERGFDLYRTLWYHNQRYHAVIDQKTDIKLLVKNVLAPHTALVKLPVKKAAQFYDNVSAYWLPGLSILLEFHLPDAPGPNWARSEYGQLQKIEWVWGMLAVALSAGELERQPTILFWDDLDAPSKQLWLGFQQLMVVKPELAERKSGFWNEDLAARFRKAAFELAGLKQVERLPRVITLLQLVGGQEILNHVELTEHLWDVATSLDLKVQPFSTTEEVPFESLLAVMSRTGVLVARHGSLLANAIFLPPGALVVELIPYHWERDGSSLLYRNLTSSRGGDVRHLAWRARQLYNVRYAHPDDARYAEWTTQECQSLECLDIHAQAGMLVDCSTVQELLFRNIPSILLGEPLAQGIDVWPPLLPNVSSARFHWEK